MPKPIYISGQTGCGKTAVALEIATRLDRVEIVNADAFQIYRGMPILSAAPSENERAHCPHHLFEFLSTEEECDAARFAGIAKKKIAEIEDRDSLPLVVGGSGLYLKAITHGLGPTPKGDPVLRAELEQLPLDELISRYRELDPLGAEKTNLKNRRYVTRNLEICLLTGKPASELKQSWADDDPDIQAIYLQRGRADIYARINLRTELMFQNGVIEEVAALGTLSVTAEKAIGISEIRELLSGGIDRETAIETIQKITRHYAKRQESWFRREPSFTSVPVGEHDTPSTIVDSVFQRLPDLEFNA